MPRWRAAGVAWLSSGMTVVLTGSDLTLAELVRVARAAERVELAPAAVERMRATRAVVEAAADLPALARLAVSGELDLDEVVSHVTDLDGINDALDRLRRGEGARTIVVLDTGLAGAPTRNGGTT